MEELNNILHLPYLTTVMLQKKDYTLSDFYGMLQIMNMKLSKMINGPGDNYTTLAVNLQHCLKERKIPLISNPLMRCAMFLDPRFKVDIDSNNELRIFTKLTLQNIWQRIQSVKNDEQREAESQHTKIRKSVDNMPELFNELDEEYDQMPSPNPDFSKDKNDIAEAIEKYERFVSGRRMKSGKSVHEFWEVNKTTFGAELYEIATIIFAIPPTQSSVERYFSALKYLFEEHRCNLKEHLLECCLLVHLNRDFYEIVKEGDISKVAMTVRMD